MKSLTKKFLKKKKTKMIFNTNKSLKKYSIFVYFILLIIFTIVSVYSIRRHGIFIETEKQTLKEQAQVTTSILTLTINSQVNQGVVPREKMRAALENIIDYTKIDSIGVYSEKGNIIISVGNNKKIQKKITNKEKVSWAENQVTYYNDLYGGIFGRYKHGYNKNRKPRENKRIKKLPPKHSKKFNSKIHQQKNKITPNHAKKINFEGKNNKRNKFLKRPHPDKKINYRNKRGRRPTTLSVVDEREKRFLKFLSTMEYINLLKSKTLPYQDLIKLLSNIVPPPDAKIVAKRLEGKELSFNLIKDYLKDYFREKYRNNVKSIRLGKIAITLPTTEYDNAVRNNFYSLIGFNVFFFIGLLSLIFLWRAFLGIAELKIYLALSEEQMNSLKDMNMTAAGLVHETKNPLGVIRGMAQLITTKNSVDKSDEDLLNKIIEETDRVTSRLNQFLSYSKPRKINLTKVLLKPLIVDIFSILEYDCEDKNIKLHSNISEEITHITADNEMLRQILFNLLLNALQAVPANTGEILLKIYKSNDSNIIIEVSDNGPGVNNDIKEDIFRPYFTGNESGTGLGLSIVKQLCLLHSWKLELIQNSEKSGATFRIFEIT